MKATFSGRFGKVEIEFDRDNATASVVSYDPTGTESSFMSKAANWLAAESSKVLSGPVEPGVYEARISSCLKCEHLEQLPAPKVGYCKRCGCGKNQRSELTVKATMPAATCPLGLWEKR